MVVLAGLYYLFGDWRKARILKTGEAKGETPDAGHGLPVEEE
jgi:hypothetical protein